MSVETSIIILSYNHFNATTGPCLESLFKDPDRDRFEIIVIDNASQDDSPEKLKRFAKGHPQLELVLGRTNRGFAGGNNDGARISKGRILLLLNSDTLVPQGAVGKLTCLMNAHPDWAMLGPVTNQAGNEQKIHVHSEQVKGVMEEGRQWCRHANGDCFPSPRLDFFCVAIRRSVYEDLDGLDERFGQGYYEDTDFSLQVMNRGLQMIFTEGVFVYHQAGRSFVHMGQNRVRQLMRENRKRLIQKHGRNAKLLHLRDCNLRVMRQYAALRTPIVDSVALQNLDYRFANRLTLARRMVPKSPMKRLFYQFQLRNLELKYGNRS